MNIVSKKFLGAMTGVILSFTNVSYADLGSSAINNNAQGYLSNAIQGAAYPISLAWAALGNFYSSSNTFAPADTFNIQTSFIPNVTSITNNSFGTLVIIFSSTAPGPIANKTIAIAPTRVSVLGAVSYVYEIPQCYTNITDTLIGATTPPPGTPIASASGGVGITCVFAPDPVATATNQVQGGGTGPSPNPGGMA